MRKQKFIQTQSAPTVYPQTLRGSITVAGREIFIGPDAIPKSSSGTAPAEAIIKLFEAGKRGVFPIPIPEDEK